MYSRYFGVEREPLPEHPTKTQAIDALEGLRCGNLLRQEAIEYYYKIVKLFIEQIKP